MSTILKKEDFQEIENIIDRRLDKKLTKQCEEFERYVGATHEAFQDSVQLLAERISGLDEKVDRIDSRVGRLETDMGEAKVPLKDLQYTVHKIEDALVVHHLY